MVVCAATSMMSAVVDSLYSLQSVEQLADSPQSAGQGSPEEGGPLAHESCYITEDEDLLRDSPESTGYYPCFRTCSHLPPDQPEEREVPSEHPGKADACIQVRGTQHNKASQWEGGPEAEPSGQEARMKPCPEQRSPVPSPEQTSEGNSQVWVSPLEPKRQVLEGLRNGDSGTPRTGLAEGRRERAPLCNFPALLQEPLSSLREALEQGTILPALSYCLCPTPVNQK
ncbi:UNVERIFIED_CONTAM: hypothetical protein K2H54_003015 [Gekko kuhli]